MKQMKSRLNQTGIHSRSAVRSLMQLSLAAVVSAALSASAQDYTKVKPYAVAVSPDYVIQPLLTVGDQVPNTSDPPSRSIAVSGNGRRWSCHRGLVNNRCCR